MRRDPSLLVPGAQSVIVVLLGYKPSQHMQGDARIAQYAYGEDYHERIKRMLYQLIAAIRQRYPDFEAKPCVDTVPISDKQCARRAGLGWIGRNTLLVNPSLGSYCNIGELVTLSPADRYDAPLENGCGDCRACADACPNKALTHSSIQAFPNPPARRQPVCLLPHHREPCRDPATRHPPLRLCLRLRHLPACMPLQPDSRSALYPHRRAQVPAGSPCRRRPRRLPSRHQAHRPQPHPPHPMAEKPEPTGNLNPVCQRTLVNGAAAVSCE